MYLLLKMVVFQPAMLVYQRVHACSSCDKGPRKTPFSSSPFSTSDPLTGVRTASPRLELMLEFAPLGDLSRRRFSEDLPVNND